MCEENGTFAVQATDGSVFTATSADAEAARVPEKAAIASAAHDIPCARASLRVVGHEPTVVDGCGQRITYKEEEHALVPPPGYTVDADIKGYRDVMVSRVALPEAEPAPAPPPTPVPAPMPAPAPTP